MIQQKVNVSAFDDGILETQVHFDKLVYEITTDDKLFQKIVLEATNLRIKFTFFKKDGVPKITILEFWRQFLFF